MVNAAFFFSVMTLFVKAAGKTLPTAEIVLVRSVFGLVVTWIMLRRAKVDPWGNRRGLLVVRGIFGFIALICFYYAVTHLPIAEATVIQYTNPVFVAVLAGLFLGERLSGREVGAMVLCLLGVALVARPQTLFGAAAAGFDPLAIAAAVGGAVATGFAYVLVRKLGATEHPLVTVFYFPLVATPIALPLVLPYLRWPTPLEAVYLLCGATCTQLAQISLTRGLQLERAGKAMSMTYLQIVFATLWGVLFFSEVPEPLAVLGMVVIVGSTLWLGREKGGDARKEAGAMVEVREPEEG